MIRSASSPPPPANLETVPSGGIRPAPSSASRRAPAANGKPKVKPEEPSSRAYGVAFWAAYVANILVTITWALLFRYADFVQLLGGTEWHLGWIVGVGMSGSVVARLFVGAWIDQHGSRIVWLSSLLALALSCFLHLGIVDHEGWAIYLVRILFSTAIAGVFGASTAFIASGVSTYRMAELIGMLGTSGFLGIMLGAQIGDHFFGGELDRSRIDALFLLSGLMAASAAPFAWWATRAQVRPTRRRRPPALWVLRRYQPGKVLLVGLISGAAISLPATFLRPYAADLSIGRIGLFFTFCGLAAVSTRFLTRRMPDRFGLPPLILFGLGMMTLSQFLFLIVNCEWLLIVPGLTFGVAQGILYPMVTAAGCSSFPERHRGLGITLVLATFDLGNLVGAPAVGTILRATSSLGLPSYPAAFASMALGLVVIALVYARRPERLCPQPLPAASRSDL